MSNQAIRATKAGKIATATMAAGFAAAMLGFGVPAAAATLDEPVEGHIQGLLLDEIAEVCATNSVKINIKNDLPAGVNPAGYKFSIYRVNGIDVTTEEGREEGRALDVMAAGDRTDRQKPIDTQTTGEEGTVEFTGLEPGMYLIVGQAPEDPAYDGYDPIPFTIFLPTGGIDKDGNLTGWDCDTDLERKLEDPEAPPPSTPSTPPTTPKTSTPGKPPTTKTTPGAPGPGPGGGSGRLPLTGVSVVGALVVAAGMVAAGVALRRRGNRTGEP